MCYGYLFVFVEVISDIGERHKPEGETQSRSQTELHGNIVESSVAGIYLRATLCQIIIAQACSYVEEESECVDRCIGCGVEHVNLIVLVYADACSSHTLVGASLQARQLPESESGIG